MKSNKLRALVFSLTALAISPAANADTCMNGYELTAIVVLETNIRHAVDAYACKIALPEHQDVYDIYQAVKEKWKKQRAEQYVLRNKIYQRIYGDDWESRVSDWTNNIALNESKAFVPGTDSCSNLKHELKIRLDDWKRIYDSAARQAAGPVFDPLRCEPVGLIKSPQSPE